MLKSLNNQLTTTTDTVPPKPQDNQEIFHRISKAKQGCSQQKNIEISNLQCCDPRSVESRSVRGCGRTRGLALCSALISVVAAEAGSRVSLLSSTWRTAAPPELPPPQPSLDSELATVSTLLSPPDHEFIPHELRVVRGLFRPEVST